MIHGLKLNKIIWHTKCIPWQLCMHAGNVSSMFQRYAFAYLLIQNSCKDLNCMIVEAIKLYHSWKYPFKAQAESDYTCVDLNNEVQFADFPSKAYLLSTSITNRLWIFFMTFIIII
jgi:hypothetical protein